MFRWKVAGLFIPGLTGLLLSTGIACWGTDAGGLKEGGAESDHPSASAITVFAAASLQEAFRDLVHSYRQASPGQVVRLNFDGSQRLRTQLEHGAEADVFASADWAQMEALAESNLLVGQPVNFASNKLVFLVNAESASRFMESPASAQGFSVAGHQSGIWSGIPRLSEPGVKIVLASGEAPVGRYSEQALAKMATSPEFGSRFVEGLKLNVVSRETNVRSVAQKVALGEADAGITYQTDARSSPISQVTRIVEIPDSVNVVAHYPIAALSDREPTLAFIDFVLSAEGQGILKSYGFRTVNGAESISP